MRLTKREKEKIIHGLVKAYDSEELDILETRKRYPTLNCPDKHLKEFAIISKKLAANWGYDFLRGWMNFLSYVTLLTFLEPMLLFSGVGF